MIITAAVGLLLHQCFDLTANLPLNWYYPFLGPYQVDVHQNYVAQVILTELTSPTEWIFCPVENI
jgi:hypothetical protein